MLRTSRVSSPLLSCLSCTVHPCLLLDNFLLKSFMNDGEFRQTACRCRKRGPVMPHFHGPFSVPSVRQGGGRGVSLDSPDLFFHSFRRVVLWLPLCPASAPPPPFHRGPCWSQECLLLFRCFLSATLWIEIFRTFSASSSARCSLVPSLACSASPVAGVSSGVPLPSRCASLLVVCASLLVFWFFESPSFCTTHVVSSFVFGLISL